jgi:iron complex outermembrane recepter protein
VTVSVKQEYYRKRESPQVMQKPGYGRQSGVAPTAADPNLDGVPVPGLPGDWNSMSNGDYRSSDTASSTAILDVKGDEHWNLRASYAHTKYEVDALFSGNLGASNAFPFMQGRRLRRQTYTNWDDTFEANATGRYELGFASLRLLVGGQYVLRRFDATAGQAPNDPAFGPIGSPRPNWDLSDPSTWNRDALPISGISTLDRKTTTRYRDRAAFAGATLGFLDARLLLLAGARLTRTESQAVQRQTGSAEPKLSAQRVTPQYGVLYKVAAGASLFATYAESFVPATDVLLVRNVVTAPAEPTHGHGVDAGLKVDVLGGRLSGTVTVFEVRNTNIVNDISELDPTTGTQSFTRVQSGEQRCSGVELDATLTPVDNWQTYLSYSYNHARIIEFSGRDTAILASGPMTPGYKEALLFHAAPLQMSAPHLANLWTRYDVAGGILAGLYLAGGTNLVFEQALLPDTPASHRQTYALFNGLLGYSWQLYPRLRASTELYGKNLSNRQYRPSQSTRSRPQELGVAFTVKY